MDIKTKEQLLAQSLESIPEEDRAAFLEILKSLEIELPTSLGTAQEKYIASLKRIKDARRELIDDISNQRFENLKKGVEKRQYFRHRLL